MHLGARSPETPLGKSVIIADRFQLTRELGKGAMGSVWLARHRALNIPCAVKFIQGKGAAAGEIRMRFEREARSAAQIRSPYVVQILDYGVWQDQPYIAMEFLEGESLGARLLRCGRLPAAEIFVLAMQIARGLTKAHALGIVHRDLKPDNIFLVREESVFMRAQSPTLAASTTAKILDFGIAKSPDGGEGFAKTQTGRLMGTPYYMSPEQIEGARSLDGRSDLWSLAVVVYQCFVGRLPFESEAIGDLFMRVMQYPIPIPSSVVPDVLPAFDAWWARAAARDPDQRFQSAAELVAALGDALGVASGSLDALAESPALTPQPSPPGDDLDTESSAAPAKGAESVVRRRRRTRMTIGAVAALTLAGAALKVTLGTEQPAVRSVAAALPVAMAPAPATAALQATLTAVATAEVGTEVIAAPAGATADAPGPSASSPIPVMPAPTSTAGPQRTPNPHRAQGFMPARARPPAKPNLGF